MKFSDSLDNMRIIMERNFRDTTDKMEIEMKEVKEKLSSLATSAEKSAQDGESVERVIHRKKIIRCNLHRFLDNATQLLCMTTLTAGYQPTQHTLVLY